MKKLTAGIFTVLMGLVTVNAAEAAVASKGYVDEVAKAAAADVTALEQTVAANKAAAEKLVSDYKAENDAKVNKNAEDIAANTALIGQNAEAIAANTEAIAGEKTAREQAVTGLDTRLQEVEKFSGEGEGSVAAQIAGALAEANDYTDAEVKELTEGAVADNAAAIAAINNAETGILKQAQTYADGLATNYDASGSAAQALADAKTYADGLDSAQKTAFENADKAINDKIGTVAEGTTVVEMIEAAQTAATYDDEEVRGLISAETTARTEADTAINTKIGTIADGKTVSGLISENAEAIATKLTDTTTISEDGVYVLTAVTVGDDTTYAWELIARETGTEQE